MKLLKILGVFFIAMIVFSAGGWVGDLTAAPVYLPLPDQEFHDTGMIGDIPIDIDCVIKDGTIKITVTGQVEGSFEVVE